LEINTGYLKMTAILFYRLSHLNKAFGYISYPACKIKEVRLSLWFLNEDNAMKAYRGSGSIAPFILDLGTRWR
jgi:hypothetical protein